MGKLAITGGEPIRKKPFDPWPVYTEKEREALEDVLICCDYEFRYRETHSLRKESALVLGLCIMSLRERWNFSW